MRIVQLVQSLQTGGVERLVANITAGLSQRGHHISVLALRSGGDIAVELAEQHVPVQILCTDHITPGALKKIRQAILALQPDLVHIHTLPAGTFGRAAIVGTGIPWIYHLHTDYYRAHHPNRSMLLREMLLGKLEGSILAISSCVRRKYCTDFRVPLNKVEVLRGGVPDTPEMDQAEARRQLHLPTDRPILLIVAGLSLHKDHLTSLRTMQLLPDNVMLLLAGDGPLFDRIQAYVKRANLQERVKLLGRRNDISLLNAASDAALLTSDYREGLGLSLVEAARAGIPCIATRTGGIPEVVRHGVNGLLVPARNPEALAEAINKVLNNKHFSSKLGQQGRERYLREWELGVYLDRLEHLYQSRVKVKNR